MLVGRAAELGALTRALTAALDGSGGVVLVGGEAGIGKSRLAAEAAAQARTAGALAGWGVAPSLGAPPFLPWRTALRSTVPAAAAQLAGTRDGGDDARLLLFEDVAEALAAVPQPVVLVLDDLQWADPGSLQLLRFLLRGLHSSPVLVVGTYRDTGLPADSPLLAVLDELPAGTHLHLAGLGVDDVGRLAAELGGEQDAAALHARTGGNPFLLEQVCTAPAGASATAALRGRLRDLAPACRRLLDLAAVAGRDVDAAVLAGALGHAPKDLLPLLDDAVAAGVLERTDGGHRFRHDLLREALLEEQPAGTAASLHWQLGTLLASAGGRDDEAARHLQAGVLAGDAATAAAVSVRAAEQAAARLAFEQAAAHLGWAAGTTPDPVLLLRLGELRRHAGDADGAAQVFEQVADDARRRGDAETLARAALGLGAGLAGFEVRLLDTRQIALLEQAAEALQEPTTLRAFVLARLSVALSFVDAPQRRAELSREAVAVAETAGDDRALAYALTTWADVVAGPDHVEERLALSSRVVALATAAGDPELTLLGHRFRVVALLEAGRVDELDREIATFTRLAERHRLPMVRWYVPLFAGCRALMRDDLDAAWRKADEAEAVGALAGSVNAPVLAGTLRLNIASERGTLGQFADDVRAMVLPWLEAEPTMIGPHVVLGVVALAEGDLPEVARRLDAMAALDFAAHARDAEWLGSLTGATQLCVAVGHTGHAARLYELLLPYAGLLVVDGIAASCLGAVDEVLAELAVLLQRPSEAARHLDAALATYTRTRMPAGLRRVRRLLGAAPVPPAPAAATGVLRREGELWLLSYAGREVRLPDAKGLHDLATLLADPGREVHVAELTGAGRLGGAVDEVLDEQARRAYRRRLRELDEDADGADPARAERARVERDALLQALAEATGLGGRARGTANDLERARQAVRARFRHLLQRLAPVHPELARHLERSVRTGTTCCYAPEHPVRWQTASAVVRRQVTPSG